VDDVAHNAPFDIILIQSNIQKGRRNTMPNLTPYTLSHDEQKDDWALRNDLTGRTIRRFDTKEEATAGGVIADAIGSQGGSVRIHKENGVFQEERTFPRSKDPRESKG
jgi:hypothetical protein